MHAAGKTSPLNSALFNIYTINPLKSSYVALIFTLATLFLIQLICQLLNSGIYVPISESSGSEKAIGRGRDVRRRSMPYWDRRLIVRASSSTLTRTLRPTLPGRPPSPSRIDSLLSCTIAY